MGRGVSAFDDFPIKAMIGKLTKAILTEGCAFNTTEANEARTHVIAKDALIY